MSNVLPRPDVTLYGLVHGILKAERARDDAERRFGRRHPYRCTQLIAPWHDNVSLGQLEFRAVQCVDLSAAGLSYFSDEPLPGNALVVSLGNEPPICLLAEVIRMERVVHELRFQYRVACRFTGRAIEP